MKILLTGQRSESLVQYASRAFHAAVGQHDRWVREIRIRLVDENASNKGGIDQRCLVRILFTRSALNRVIGATANSAYEAIDLAAERAKRMVGKLISRTRSRSPVRGVRSIRESFWQLTPGRRAALP